MKTTLVLADEHASVRQMLARTLEREEDCTILGEGRTGFEALNLCRRLKPRILITELILPELSGAEVVRQLHAEAAQTRALIYTGACKRESILVALDAAPLGLVQKHDSLETLRAAVRAVAAGCSFFTPFAAQLLASIHGSTGARPILTARERVVLQMVAEGLSNKEVAGRLSISAKTVEHHRAALMHKLDLHDVAGLVRFALREGMSSLN